MLKEEKESYNVVASGSISFFDANKPLAFDIENPDINFKLSIIFKLEKVSLKKPAAPQAEKLKSGQIQITIPVDKDKPTGGSTPRPAFVGSVDNKSIFIHFRLEVLQEEHFLLEYTLFSEDGLSESRKK